MLCKKWEWVWREIVEVSVALGLWMGVLVWLAAKGIVEGVITLAYRDTC